MELLPLNANAPFAKLTAIVGVRFAESPMNMMVVLEYELEAICSYL